MNIDEWGTKSWINERGDYHRENGPAVIHSDGSEIWCQNGKVHREDGPAVIDSNSKNGWWLNNCEYSFTEWANELNLGQKTRLAMVLKWNPQ